MSDLTCNDCHKKLESAGYRMRMRGPTYVEICLECDDKVVAKDNPVSEKVNHPPHYGGDEKYETIKCLEAWFSVEEYSGFCLGNAIKYISRAKRKGDTLTDLRKAAWYLNRIIVYLEAKKP